MPDADFVGLEHIEPDTTRLLGCVSASSMSSSGVRFQVGDVLYSRMRPYLNKVWLADRDGLCSGEFIVYPSDHALHGSFLRYRLNAPDFVRFANGNTTGDRPRVGAETLAEFPILLPPKEEQARIADRIDELFTDLDAGVAALERVKKKLPRYRAALLHAAVTGRLTADWRAEHGDGGESAEVLLQRILTARRADWEARTLAKYEADGKTPPKGWQKRYKEPIKPDSTDLPKLPRGWMWVTLETIADVIGGVAKNQKEEDRPGRQEIAYLRVANVQAGYLNLSEIKTIRASAKDIHELRLRPNDILLTEGGDRDKLGRGWIWEGQIEPCIHQNHIFRSRLVLPDLIPELVCFAANGYGRKWFSENGKQSVNLASISLGQLRRFPVALSPVAEQGAIIDTLRERLSQIDSTADEVERSLFRAKRLRQSILKSAFEGRLVPQDPKDEPASVLLDRLQYDVDSASKQTTRKPRRNERAAGGDARTATLFNIANQTSTPDRKKKPHGQSSKTKAKK